MTRLTHFVLISLVTGACIAPAFGQTTPVTSAQPASSATPAPAASSSSAAAEAFRIVPEDQIKQWWIGAKGNPAPKYPLDAVRDNVQGCIAIAYTIHANGTATPLHPIKGFWTEHEPAVNKQIEQRAIGSVAHWHFSPAPENASRAPVLTFTVFAFTVGAPSTIAEQPAKANRMKAKCAVSNFAQDMQKLLGSPDNSSAAQ